MKCEADRFLPETKWAMAAGGLTGALIAHLALLHDALGASGFKDAVSGTWAAMGRGCAEQALSLGLPAGDAARVAKAGVAMAVSVLGPEYEIEEAALSEDRAVMKVVACPFNNRMQEAGVAMDVLSACDTAFWADFVKALNPDITMRHGKQMHRGDPFCEWIFEKRK